MGKIKTLAVIIPNHNKSVYIKETIESALNQKKVPDEIIVVDDCSTDCSKDIALEYQKKFPSIVRVFCLDTNMGVQHARNYGASKAMSDFITFIDSDDYYFDSNVLDTCLEKAKRNRLVYKPLKLFDSGIQEIINSYIPKRVFSFFKHNSTYCYLKNLYMLSWPYAYIVPKSAFFKIKGYNFEYNYLEDLDILLKYSRIRLKIHVIDGYGLVHRVNDNEVSHLSSRTQLSEKAMAIIQDRYKNKLFIKSKICHKIFIIVDLVIFFIKHSFSILCKK